MQLIHILIVDESPDFARSLGCMIIDVIGQENVIIRYAYNIEDGLIMVGLREFQYVFIATDKASGNGEEIRDIFNKLSFNPRIKIIAVSFHNEPDFKIMMEEAGASQYLVKDEIGIEELVSIFNEV